MKKPDPVKVAQAIELLKDCQEYHHHVASRSEDVDESFNHGRCIEAADVAESGLFNYLNCCSTFVKDGEATVVIREHLGVSA